MSQITIDDLKAVDIRVGTVRAAQYHDAARDPALVLEIDFGTLGIRTSSAQLAALYEPASLVGRQVMAVVNLPPRRVAGIRSEVLVLAALCPEAGTVLMQPERPVADGSPIA